MKIIALISAFIFATALTVSAHEKILYPAIDSHLHYLDFTQRTDGFLALINKMNAAGVEKAVIFGMPIVKMWSEDDPIRPDYYLDTDSRGYYYSGTDFILAEELEKQDRAVRERFYPFISGINPLDRNSAEYIETLLRLYPGFWKGIGEVMSRHDNLTAFTYGEPPRANHPALMSVYKIAAEHKLPVLIHHNITSANQKSPIYLSELEKAVSANPSTTFIWAHVGISRNLEVPTLNEDLRRVLTAYPNLNVDISWVVFDDYIAKNEETLKDWALLIEDFSDRVMIGSDKVGHWATYPEVISRYNSLLTKLSPATARKITKENILRILAQ